MNIKELPTTWKRVKVGETHNIYYDNGWARECLEDNVWIYKWVYEVPSRRGKHSSGEGDAYYCPKTESFFVHKKGREFVLPLSEVTQRIPQELKNASIEDKLNYVAVIARMEYE